MLEVVNVVSPVRRVSAGQPRGDLVGEPPNVGLYFMDAVLQALSDENRRASWKCCGITRPGVSRHQRVLRQAGLVDVREPMAELDEWLSRIIGSLRRLDDGKGALTMEDFYDTGIDDLWSAVTDPDRLARCLATAPDETVIEANLTPVGGRTRLILEERGLPPEKIHSYGAGWQTHVEDLATYLTGREPGEWYAH